MLETVAAWASVIILSSILLAGLAVWFCTIYQVFQMIRKRESGVSWVRMHWPTNALLTDSGRIHRNRALLGYALFIALVGLGFLTGWLLSTATSS